MNRIFSTKAGATKLLIGAVVGLITFKVVVSWLTGGISILAQATDSLLDLFAGIITLLAIRATAKPADARHPYGHGKAEDIAGIGQGILILIAGGLIIYSAIGRIMTRRYSIELAEAGIAVMAASIVVSIFLSRHLFRVSRASGSTALEANARNVAADVYSTSAVLAGLAIVRFTGLDIIDSMLAIGVAIYILKVALDTIRKPVSGLLDESLPLSQQAVIEDCLRKHSPEVSSYHALRTRRAGSQSYVDLHLVVARGLSLEQAHKICDQIEDEIQSVLREANVIIHAEPCESQCEQCSAICSERRTS